MNTAGKGAVVAFMALCLLAAGVLAGEEKGACCGCDSKGCQCEFSEDSSCQCQSHMEGRPAGRGRGPRAGMEQGGFGVAMNIAERLGLTNNQREKVKAVMNSHTEELQALSRKMFDERKSLCDLIQADEMDEKAIRAQAAKISAVEADLAVIRAKIAQEIKPLLSAEQKQRMKELKEEAEKRWSERGAAKGCGEEKCGRVAKEPARE